MLPRVTKRAELVRTLRKFGWEETKKHRSRESFMVKGKRSLSIPNQHNEDIRVSLLSRLLSRAEISHEEWNDAREARTRNTDKSAKEQKPDPESDRD